MADLRSKSLGLKELEGLLKKVYAGNVSSEQIKNIFNQLDTNSRGKFVAGHNQTINDFLNLTDILNSDPTLVAYDFEFRFWKK